MRHKFKIGSQVQIREDLNVGQYSERGIASGMVNYAGQIVPRRAARVVCWIARTGVYCHGGYIQYCGNAPLEVVNYREKVV